MYKLIERYWNSNLIDAYLIFILQNEKKKNTRNHAEKQNGSSFNDFTNKFPSQKSHHKSTI